MCCLVSPRILRKAGSSRHLSLTALMGAERGSLLRRSDFVTGSVVSTWMPASALAWAPALGSGLHRRQGSHTHSTSTRQECEQGRDRSSAINGQYAGDIPHHGRRAAPRHANSLTENGEWGNGRSKTRGWPSDFISIALLLDCEHRLLFRCHGRPSPPAPPPPPLRIVLEIASRRCSALPALLFSARAIKSRPVKAEASSLHELTGLFSIWPYFLFPPKKQKKSSNNIPTTSMRL
jgi:hypothetical protein